MKAVKDNFTSFTKKNGLRIVVVVLSLTLTTCAYMAATLRFEGDYIHRHQWISTFADYKKELREEIYPSTPVLLIAGDSTPLFGIDAGILSENLGRPVLNYGLGAASGLSTILTETLNAVKSGDEVVLIVSDRLLAESSELYLNQALVNILDQDEFVAASWRNRINSFLFTPWDIILFGFGDSVADKHFHQVYQTHSLGELGDMKASVIASNTPPKLPNKITQAYPVSKSAITRLRSFQKDLNDIDVKLSLLLSPRMRGHTERKRYVSVFSDNIEALRTAGIRVLTSPDDVSQISFDKQYLYDFDTHLNTTGRAIFTDYLSKKILQQDRKTLL